MPGISKNEYIPLCSKNNKQYMILQIDLGLRGFAFQRNLLTLLDVTQIQSQFQQNRRVCVGPLYSDDINKISCIIL